jgi:hypothetical protein
MRAVRARFVVTVKHCAIVCAAWLLSVVCTSASPITIGTFEFQNDISDPFLAGPTFVVTNDSALAGFAATFGDIHLLFGLDGLGSVLDAYLTLTLLDSLTSAVLPGTLSLAATNPPLCVGCTNRMIDFTHGSTLAIQFDPALPGDASPIPEPMSLFLVGSGIAACAAKKRWLSR